MIKGAMDTHRVMYRNARIRALDLSTRTQPVSFYNNTDVGVYDEIGSEVFTDAAGYIYYGDANNNHKVDALVLMNSAIVQVQLPGNTAWDDIQWIVEVPNNDGTLSPSAVGVMYGPDGQIEWAPGTGQDYHRPDFALVSQVAQGEWAEGELHITDSTSQELPIDQWTHSIIFHNGAGSEYHLTAGTGRNGQVITIVNLSSSSITLKAYQSGGIQTINLDNDGDVFTVHNYNSWQLRNRSTTNDSLYTVTDTAAEVNVHYNGITKIKYKPDEQSPINQALTLYGLAGEIVEIENTTPFVLSIIGSNITERIPAYTSEKVAFVGENQLRLCDATKSGYVVSSSVSLTLSNINDQYQRVINVSSFGSSETLSITTVLEGAWLPFRIIAAEGFTLEPPGAGLYVEVNGEEVAFVQHVSVGESISAGTTICAGQVRIVGDSYDFQVTGGMLK